MPETEVVSSAILKVAAGTTLLAASLSPHVLLAEVGCLLTLLWSFAVY